MNNRIKQAERFKTFEFTAFVFVFLLISDMIWKAFGIETNALGSIVAPVCVTSIIVLGVYKWRIEP